MPPRNKKSSRPRPSMAKAKRMVTKQKKAKAKKNMDNFFLKAKSYLTVTPTQGGTVSNYISLFFKLLDPVTIQAVTQNAEFNLYRTMYDKVRINSVKVTMKPKANVLDMTNAQNDGSYTVSGDGMIHSVIDRDDQPPANIARLSRYGSYRRTSVLKPLTRSYSIKYPTGVWLDCQNIYSDTTLLTRLGATGGVYIYAENLLEDKLELYNEPFADILLEYNCVFQGKNSANLTYDPDTGNVTLSPTAPGQIIANSTLTAVGGTIADKRVDLSGNLVDVKDDSLP